MSSFSAETRTAPCGTVEYAKLCVPHDWTPKPLNHSEVVAYVKDLGDVWIAGKLYRQDWVGHKFADGSVCNGKCA